MRWKGKHLAETMDMSLVPLREKWTAVRKARMLGHLMVAHSDFLMVLQKEQ